MKQKFYERCKELGDHEELSEEDFKVIEARLPEVEGALSKAKQMKQEGKGWFAIALAILIEYGPEILAILAKIFAKTGK